MLQKKCVWQVTTIIQPALRHLGTSHFWKVLYNKIQKGEIRWPIFLSLMYVSVLTEKNVNLSTNLMNFFFHVPRLRSLPKSPAEWPFGLIRYRALTSWICEEDWGFLCGSVLNFDLCSVKYNNAIFIFKNLELCLYFNSVTISCNNKNSATCEQIGGSFLQHQPQPPSWQQPASSGHRIQTRTPRLRQTHKDKISFRLPAAFPVALL